MPSIVSGFEYDIFISYRHNDNRSGWVTDFVKALQEELASTIKEQVSVYFDTNPHDGLLDTHDVDDSLRDKLKCLIFIPIISQTYCDPKSFAWKNEFLAFKSLAGGDRFGLKVKLQNGNVASRILPVRIHELEKSDKELIEAELGVLRSVDFIYHSPGVVRPLLAHEEDAKANLDHIYYRDQINKVVRATKELIMAMQAPALGLKQEVKHQESVSPRSRMNVAWVAWGLLLVGIITFGIFYFTPFKSKMVELENSVAVLPFENLSNDPDQEYFCDGTTEQVISSLARLKDLKVIARTSVLQYKKTTKTIAQIGKELNVTHVLESSVRKFGNQIRVTAQLIAVKDESHLWAEDFDNKLVTDIFQIQDEVATKIAASLKDKLLPEEKEKLKSEKSSNPEAYEHYLKGEYAHNYYLRKILNEDFALAENEFKIAIKLDSNYATARAGLANLYDSRSNIADNEKDRVAFRKLADRAAREAFRLNPTLPYSLLVQFQIWAHGDGSEASLDSAFKYVYKSFLAAPNRGISCSEFGGFYLGVGLYDNALAMFKRAREIDPSRAFRYVALSFTYYSLGEMKLAEESARKALSLQPNHLVALLFFFNINCDRKNLKEAELLREKIIKINPERDHSILDAQLLAERGEKEKALSMHVTKDIQLIYLVLKMKKEVLDYMEKNPTNYLEFKNFHYDFLRGDPRFEKIVEKAKALYEVRLKKYGSVDIPKN